MVILMAKFGEHSLVTRTTFRSDADVKRNYSAQGGDFSRIVEDCRDYSKRIPLFENVLGSTWQVSNGATVSIEDHETGEETNVVKGPGLSALHGYLAIFESAVESINRAVDETSYTDFLSAAAQGVASIEAYINYRVNEWNKKHPDKQLIDSRQKKVSLDTKIDKWIPIMNSGKRMDKGGKTWHHYKILRGIRDDVLIHPKESGQGISLEDLADKINMFRTGIAKNLIQLHLLFDEKIPSKIIRSAFAPDVDVVEI